MCSCISRLPNFFDGVADFAALSCAKNFAQALNEGGCDHVLALKGRESYTDPSLVNWAGLRITLRAIKDFTKFC